MSKIMALDIALNTGFAVGDGTPGGTVFGTVYFHRWKQDWAECGRRFSEWLGAMIDEHLPSHIVVEAPFFRGKSSNLLAGLVWEAHREAEFHDIPRSEYRPTQVKKFLTDNGSAGKDDVMFAAWARGFDVKDDHQADAVALLLLHAEKTAGSKPTAI